MGLSVMISSTLVDMEDERVAAVEKILRMSHQPAVCEHWPNTGAKIAELSKVAAENCDVYVCIIGDRYGSPPPGGEKRSYTEIEFDAARDAAKPMSVFVKKTPQLRGDSDADLDQLRLRRDFVRKIQSQDILVHYWSERHELVSLLGDALHAHGLSLLPQATDAESPARRAPEIVHPYTLLKGRFAGRKRHLADMDNWALGSTPVLTLVAHGGFGKSALAWTWLHQQTEREDSTWTGAFYFSFYGHDANYEKLVAELHRYLLQLDAKASVGSSFGEQEKTVLKCLANERILLVLDGFEDQLEAHNHLRSNVDDNSVNEDAAGDFARISDRRLLNFITKLNSLKPKTRVLITSRYMPQDFLVGLGAREGFMKKEIGGFDVDEAREFWASLQLDPTDPDLPAFVDKMTGYPLALQVAASQLGPVVPTLRRLFERTPDFNPLREGLKPDGARDDVFRAALLSLSNAERSVLRKLAWLRGAPSLRLLTTLLCRQAAGGERPFPDQASLKARLDLMMENGEIKRVGDRYHVVRTVPDARAMLRKPPRPGGRNDHRGEAAILMHLRWTGDGQTLDALALKVCDTRPFETSDQLENALSQLIQRSLVGVERGRARNEPARFDLHPVIRGVIQAREANEAGFLTNTQIVEALRSQLKSQDTALTVHDVEPRIQLFLSLIQSGEPHGAAVESNMLGNQLDRFDAYQLMRQMWAEFFHIKRKKEGVTLDFKFNEREFPQERQQAISIFSMRLAIAAKWMQDWDLAAAGYHTHQNAGYCLDPMCHTGGCDALEARGLFATSDKVVAEAIAAARNMSRDQFDSRSHGGRVPRYEFVERRLLDTVGALAIDRGDIWVARLCLARRKKVLATYGPSALQVDEEPEDGNRKYLLMLSRLAEAEKSYDAAIAIARGVLSEAEDRHLSHMRQALLQLGQIYNKLGRYTVAEDVLERYRDLDPHGPDGLGTLSARIALGEALIGQRRFDDAEHMIQWASTQAADQRNRDLLAACLLAKAALERARSDAPAERTHLNAAVACFQVEEGTRRGWPALEEALTGLRQGGWQADAERAEKGFALALQIDADLINPPDELYVSEDEARFVIEPSR